MNNGKHRHTHTQTTATWIVSCKPGSSHCTRTHSTIWVENAPKWYLLKFPSLKQTPNKFRRNGMTVDQFAICRQFTVTVSSFLEYLRLKPVINLFAHLLCLTPHAENKYIHFTINKSHENTKEGLRLTWNFKCQKGKNIKALTVNSFIWNEKRASKRKQLP